MTDEKMETLIDRLMSAKGDEIKAARERLGMTQADLAAKAGTNQQTIDRLERGLTRQSKYMPEIREVLGLSLDAPEESLLRFSAKYSSGYGVRAHLPDEYRNTEKMPVFTMEFGIEDEKAVWILQKEPAAFLPRSYPVENSHSAYGIVVPDDRMHPIMKEGEVAIVDPDGSPEFGSEVFMLHGMQDGRTAGMLCTWVGFSTSEDEKEQFRKIQFWNPQENMLARWLTWPAMAPVVAKLPMPKK